MFENPPHMDTFGKPCALDGHTVFQKKILERLDFPEIRALTPMVGPTILYHTWPHLSSVFYKKNEIPWLNRKPWDLLPHRGHFH